MFFEKVKYLLIFFVKIYKAFMAVKPIISIKNVSVVYNQGLATEFQALRDVDLEIYEKEYVIFFGPSGSGKSTLLYTIAGLESPTKGSVSVYGGRNLSELPEEELMEYHRNFVGMIFQAFYLVPTLTAQGNIELPMVFRGVDNKKRSTVSEALMSRFGISSYSGNLPTGMSGGQQQRVAIARSLVNKPSLVLADEPVGNLDSENAAVVVDLIADLNKTDNKTVIHVTHDPRHLSRADRIFYMKDGEIVRIVTNRDVLKGQKTSDSKSAIDKVAAMNPYSTEEQMKAKLILNSILMPYGYHQMEKMEQTAGKYIAGLLSDSELVKMMDMPEEEGGVGLYKQTAEKISKQIIDQVAEIKHFEKIKDNSKEIKKNATQLMDYLIDHCGHKIKEDQKKRFLEAIAYRLSDEIGSEKLQLILDEPFKDGGVGLDKRRAKDITEKIELLLIEYK
jgi:putative ABC transport system ATP-binding protein